MHMCLYTYIYTYTYIYIYIDICTSYTLVHKDTNEARQTAHSPRVIPYRAPLTLAYIVRRPEYIYTYIYLNVFFPHT